MLLALPALRRATSWKTCFHVTCCRPTGPLGWLLPVNSSPLTRLCGCWCRRRDLVAFRRRKSAHPGGGWRVERPSLPWLVGRWTVRQPGRVAGVVGVWLAFAGAPGLPYAAALTLAICGCVAWYLRRQRGLVRLDNGATRRRRSRPGRSRRGRDHDDVRGAAPVTTVELDGYADTDLWPDRTQTALAAGW